MNIFTESLPDFVDIDGQKYPVLTDFRIWTEFDGILHLRNVGTKDKVMMIFNLCFDKERCPFLPEDWEMGMEALSSFYLCGKKAESKKCEKAGGDRAFSFCEDSGYIYSAFLTQYGIDLVTIPYMHWYLFRTLFDSLEDTRQIMKIIRWRMCDTDSVRDREKKKHLKKMKELYKLPSVGTYRQCDGEVAEVLSQMF